MEKSIIYCTGTRKINKKINKYSIIVDFIQNTEMHAHNKTESAGAINSSENASQTNDDTFSSAVHD